MHLRALLFLTTDVAYTPYVPTCTNESTMQNALMRLFFADITNAGRAELADGVDPKNYLNYAGVDTSVGVVDGIDYYRQDIGNLNIHFLPPTTRNVRVSQCQQHYQLHTRMLPKRLLVLSVYQNELFGTIDLSHLPPKFERLFAFKNAICGPIDLTFLPSTVLVINLRFNRINQKVVRYGNLPLKVKQISLGSQANGSSVRAIRAISADQSVDAKRAHVIFGDLKLLTPPK